MAVVEKDIFIVGCGPGSADYLPAISRKMAEESDVLSGSRRLLELFPGCGRDRIVMGSDVEEFLGEMDKLLRNGRRLTVLVSGDPGVFSLATRVIHRFGLERCHVVPAVSSVQVAFARVGLEWAGARIIAPTGESRWHRWMNCGARTGLPCWQARGRRCSGLRKSQCNWGMGIRWCCVKT